MATQIDDPNTIVPCSECGQPVAVKDAIIVPREPGHPERRMRMRTGVVSG